MIPEEYRATVRFLFFLHHSLLASVVILTLSFDPCLTALSAIPSPTESVGHVGAGDGNGVATRSRSVPFVLHALRRQRCCLDWNRAKVRRCPSMIDGIVG